VTAPKSKSKPTDEAKVEAYLAAKAAKAKAARKGNATRKANVKAKAKLAKVQAVIDLGPRPGTEGHHAAAVHIAEKLRQQGGDLRSLRIKLPDHIDPPPLRKGKRPNFANNNITDLLKAAKADIAAGEGHMRAAAEHIAKASEQGATQQQIATQVGKSQPWVSALLQWRLAGYPETAFGPQAKGKRDKAQAAKKEDDYQATNNPDDRAPNLKAERRTVGERFAAINAADAAWRTTANTKVELPDPIDPEREPVEPDEPAEQAGDDTSPSAAWLAGSGAEIQPANSAAEVEPETIAPDPSKIVPALRDFAIACRDYLTDLTEDQLFVAETIFSEKVKFLRVMGGFYKHLEREEEVA
jgi:hypothetical protein